MPRKPRIQYPGATYHVMCRGDHQEAIFRGDDDCFLFLKTLGETCDQTGWLVHAWVLMGNHYHLLIETPHANLVTGMKWFQGTYTQRFNARHTLRGHLFQGRYKALLVDTEDPHYFRCVAAYIHMNPARAGMIDLKKGALLDHPWSSYPGIVRKSRRLPWMSVDRLLACYGRQDDVPGRRYYAARMKKQLLELQHSTEPWRVDEEWDKIRRGWCFGDQAFRKAMLEKIESLLDGTGNESYSGPAVRDYAIQDAQHFLATGLSVLSLKKEQLESLPKGDVSKRLLAWLIKKNTRMSNQWIATHLQTGHPANLPKFVREIETSNDADIIKARGDLETILKY